VATGLNGSIPFPGQENRKVVVRVPVRVPYRSTVNDHTVIKQSAVPFLDLLEPIKEMCQKRTMITVDFC
jgi:hypothetical protein